MAVGICFNSSPILNLAVGGETSFPLLSVCVTFTVSVDLTEVLNSVVPIGFMYVLGPPYVCAAGSPQSMV